MIQHAAPLLEVRDLTVHFVVRRGLFGAGSFTVKAVNGVDFEIGSGETFGLVGESGSGKSTVGRALLRLVDCDGGSIFMNGKPVHELSGRMLDFRRDLQVVFQDPYSSLNPSMVAGEIIGEPLTIHYGLRGTARDERVAKLLEEVGLRPDQAEQYPSEFSGGQRQRIAIARALALEPKLIVCDEAVSALDVSTQSQVIALLEDLQERLGLSYLFIAHDLAVVRHISHRIGVMYLGQLMEVGPAERVYEQPAHPYTRMLLAAAPIADPVLQKKRREARRKLPTTELPAPTDLPRGCPFENRCSFAVEVCKTVRPPPAEVRGGGWTACHLHPLDRSVTTSDAGPPQALDHNNETD